MQKILMLGLIVLATSGCTNKDWYNSLQPDKAGCSKLPMQQRAACNKSVDEQMTYDEYKKQREKL